MSWWEIDLFWPLFLLSQLSGVAVVVIMGYWIQNFGHYQFGWDDSAAISYHAFMFTLGMVFLFGEAMLLFPVPRRMHIKSHVIRQVLHGVTHCVAVIFSIVGLKAVFLSKKQGGYLDLYSVHSWLGMTSAMLFFVQYGVAMVIYIVGYFTKTKLFSARFKIQFTSLHTFFGFVLFAMAIASCLSGMAGWLTLFGPKYGEVINVPTLLGNFYTLLMLLFGVLVAFIATRPPPKSSKRKAASTNGDLEQGKSTKKIDHEMTSHTNEATVEEK